MLKDKKERLLKKMVGDFVANCPPPRLFGYFYDFNVSPVKWDEEAIGVVLSFKTDVCIVGRLHTVICDLTFEIPKDYVDEERCRLKTSFVCNMSLNSMDKGSQSMAFDYRSLRNVCCIENIVPYDFRYSGINNLIATILHSYASERKKSILNNIFEVTDNHTKKRPFSAGLHHSRFIDLYVGKDCDRVVVKRGEIKQINLGVKLKDVYGGDYALRISPTQNSQRGLCLTGFVGLGRGRFGDEIGAIVTNLSETSHIFYEGDDNFQLEVF